MVYSKIMNGDEGIEEKIFFILYFLSKIFKDILDYSTK